MYKVDSKALTITHGSLGNRGPTNRGDEQDLGAMTMSKLKHFPRSIHTGIRDSDSFQYTLHLW
jgi:hypothetical protein